MSGEKQFTKTKVVSRHLVRDWFQGIRNVLGLELKSYSDLIDRTLQELLETIKKEGTISWYRISVNEITNGAIMITVYGEYK